MKLLLLFTQSQIRVSQVGGGVLYFQEDTLLPEPKATLVVDVDGQQTRREITILDHTTPSKRIRFV